MSNPSKQQQLVVLNDYLRGDITLVELQTALAPIISLSIDGTSARADYHRQFDCVVPIEPSSVRPFLEKYVGFVLDEKAVADWATVIRLIDAYGNPLAFESLPDAEADAIRDPLWDLLGELASPEVFGEITREKVRAALDELARLQRQYDRILYGAT